MGNMDKEVKAVPEQHIREILQRVREKQREEVNAMIMATMGFSS